MIDPKTSLTMATDYVNNITPSVVALCRVAKVSPKEFAVALYDNDANGDFLTDLMVAVRKEIIKKAKLEAEKE